MKSAISEKELASMVDFLVDQIIKLGLQQEYFNGVPDDQIHPEVTHIVHNINTHTGHNGLKDSNFWWCGQFHDYYIEKHGRLGNKYCSQMEDLSQQMAQLSSS